MKERKGKHVEKAAFSVECPNKASACLKQCKYDYVPFAFPKLGLLWRYGLQRLPIPAYRGTENDFYTSLLYMSLPELLYKPQVGPKQVLLRKGSLQSLYKACARIRVWLYKPGIGPKKDPSTSLPATNFSTSLTVNVLQRSLPS